MDRVQKELPVAEPARVGSSPADHILVAFQLRREYYCASAAEFERQLKGLPGDAETVHRNVQDRDYGTSRRRGLHPAVGQHRNAFRTFPELGTPLQNRMLRRYNGGQYVKLFPDTQELRGVWIE